MVNFILCLTTKKIILNKIFNFLTKCQKKNQKKLKNN